MKRSTRLLIGFAAAALTYASLMAFAGTPYKNRHRLYSYHSQYGRHPCKDYNAPASGHSGTSPDRAQPQDTFQGKQ